MPDSNPISATNIPPLATALAALKTTLFPSGIPADWVTVAGQQATLKLPFAAGPGVHKVLSETPVLAEYEWQLQLNIALLDNSQPELPKLHGNVIVVSSGKGGVGKSSVTVHLAIALQQLGARVGILDADIYGPSMPTMLGGSDEKLVFNEQKKMQPHLRHGVHVSSLGYLVEPGDAAIWRGPMASAALQQLFRDTQWPKLDYLLVDMPPGTGDIQLTFAQKLPITGAVVVTTPQTVALADAEKGIAMFRKVSVPITGLIENMSYFECSACGQQDAVFGEQGGARVAEQHQVPLLGQWPLATRIRAALDEGAPLSVSQPEDPISQRMLATAELLAANLYAQRAAGRD